MAVDSEAKRWSMLAFANGPIRTHVFNPDTSGLVSIEKITTLLHYGGISWANPSGFQAAWANRSNYIHYGGLT